MTEKKTSSARDEFDPNNERLERLVKDIASKLGTPAYHTEKDEMARKLEDYIHERPERKSSSTGSS